MKTKWNAQYVVQKHTENNFSPDFSDSDYRGFSDQAMDEHFKGWLLEMKDQKKIT